MKNKIKVAHIIGKMGSGGVEAVVMNYFRNIDRESFEFTFIVDEDSALPQKEEIESLGGSIIIVPKYQKLHLFIFSLIKTFKKNKYDIVHSHLNTLSVFPLFAAWVARIKVRIAHNHSTTNEKEKLRNMIKSTLKPFAKIFATHYFACTKFAGEYLFGKRNVENGTVTIINNAIDIDSFKYDEQIRNKIRKGLDIDDVTTVIGHIGRFTSQKNHEFMIDVFSNYKNINSKSKLLLIGEGPLQEEMEQKVKKLGIGDSVIFFGTTTKPYEYYQAMDFFLFPSLYEGLGMVLVEAQYASLPSISSTEVPLEAKVSDLVEFISLKEEAIVWANLIEDQLDKGIKRETNYVDSEIYDIEKEAKELEKVYKKIVRK